MYAKCHRHYKCLKTETRESTLIKQEITTPRVRRLDEARGEFQKKQAKLSKTTYFKISLYNNQSVSCNMTGDELRKGLSEWGKVAKEALLQKCKSQTQLSTLHKESEELSCEVRVEYNRFSSLLRVQRELLQNIVKLVPLIEEKRHLEVEIAREQEQLQEDEKVHQEKVAARRRNSEVALEELKKKFDSQKNEAVEKAKKEEFSHQKEVNQLDEEIEKLTDKLKQQKTWHLDTVSDLESKKVHAVELEYKAKLEEMGKNFEDCKAQNVQLKEELHAVHEALRHQELLSIVRNVPPWSRNATDSPAPEQISVESPNKTRARKGYNDSSGETSQMSPTKDVDLGEQEKTISLRNRSSNLARRKLFKRKATDPLI
ncbi:spindle assembly abnormal protein 6-like isoform X2 [Macrobrachium rosenbergii]|uniref:spindle assembly abnormal protein 6-like isoform X2 n=1 Tax=Macrobrachium rosenbergii TaxID=79674 RepID=UPI0034D571F1